MRFLVTTILDSIKNMTIFEYFLIAAIILFVFLALYLVEIIRNDDFSENLEKNYSKSKSETNKNSNLVDILNEIQKNYVPAPIDLSNYEEELENTAIISYDELLNRTKKNISYDENYESGFDDLSVKKVISYSETQELVNLPKAIMMSCESEKDFIEALKELQQRAVK